MRFTVRVSKQACANKEEAMNQVRGFKAGWGANNEELSVQEIAEKWLAGYSIAPAKMHRGKSNDANWISQQIFAVDVDNENGDGERANEDNYVTPEEVLNMSTCAGLPPAVIYSSFSSTQDYQKFRVIYVLDEVVHTRELHNEVTAKLYSVFMKNGYCVADTRCRDLARVYYGGKELLHQDYEAVVSLAQIRQLSSVTSPRINVLRSRHDGNGDRQSDFLPQSKMHSDILRGVTTPALSAIMNNDPLELREILFKGGDSTVIFNHINRGTVPTFINPYNYMKELPLHELLGVSVNSSFRCIMHGHEDINPSASVRKREDGTYAYYCYTCFGVGNGLTLIDLVKDATSCDLKGVVQFVESVLGIRIESEHEMQCSSRCNTNLSFITSDQFKTGKWEPLYRHMMHRKIFEHYLYYIERAKIHAASSGPLIGVGVPIFFESVRETAEHMCNRFPYSKGTGKNSVERKRNELAHLGLIRKIAELDGSIYFKAKEYQERMGNRYHKEFLSIPEVTDELLAFALQQISEAKKVGERAKYRTRLGIISSRGEEVADRIYAQGVGEKASKFRKDFIDYLWRTVARLATKGWTSEHEIVEVIKRESRYLNVEQLVGQLRPLITDGTYYTLQIVNKVLRNQLSLPDSILARSKIIVPIKQDQQGQTDLISNG